MLKSDALKNKIKNKIHNLETLEYYRERQISLPHSHTLSIMYKCRQIKCIHGRFSPFCSNSKMLEKNQYLDQARRFEFFSRALMNKSSMFLFFYFSFLLNSSLSYYSEREEFKHSQTILRAKVKGCTQQWNWQQEKEKRESSAVGWSGSLTCRLSTGRVNCKSSSETRRDLFSSAPLIVCLILFFTSRRIFCFELNKLFAFVGILSLFGFKQFLKYKNKWQNSSLKIYYSSFQ